MARLRFGRSGSAASMSSRIALARRRSPAWMWCSAALTDLREAAWRSRAGVSDWASSRSSPAVPRATVSGRRRRHLLMHRRLRRRARTPRGLDGAHAPRHRPPGWRGGDAANGGGRTAPRRRPPRRTADGRNERGRARREGVRPSRRPPALLPMRRSRRRQRSGGSAAGTRQAGRFVRRQATPRLAVSPARAGVGNRERHSWFDRHVGAERSGNLEGEQRIAAGGGCDAAQHRLGEAGSDLAFDQHDQGVAIERSEDRAVVLSSPNARRNPSGSTSSAGRRTVVTKPMRWPSMRRAAKPTRSPLPNRASRHRRRRQASPALGESGEHVAQGHADSSRVGVAPRPRPRAKNGDVERFLLDNRQPPTHLVDSLADQIGDCRRTTAGPRFAHRHTSTP